MKFFELDPSLEDAVFDPEKGIKVKFSIEDENGNFTDISEDDVIEAEFASGFDSNGGIVSSSHIVLIDNGLFPDEVKMRDGRVKVLFTAGETGRYLHRFTMYTDDKGFIRKKQGGMEGVIEVYLEDFPGRLKRMGGYKDWSEAEVLTDMKFSDKEDPENSILYRIASKGDIAPNEIDSCTVLLTLPYVKLTKEPWDEMCSLASSSFALLEGGTDKKIIFSSSPYRSGGIVNEEETELDAELFYSIETESALDLYYNDIRLKWSKAERLLKQVLWNYDDVPVFYDDDLKKSYPFRAGGVKRDIESEDITYIAPFEVRLPDGEKIKVVYADLTDTESEVAANMESDTGGLSLSSYDTSTYRDRALIRLYCSSDTDLYSLSISARPIILRENFSCFRRDAGSIESYGLKVMNKSGKYFSDDLVLGKKHYEEWTERILSLGKRRIRRFRLKSEFGLVHARVGSKVKLTGIEDNGISLSVERLSFRYKRGEIFKAELVMIEDLPIE